MSYTVPSFMRSRTSWVAPSVSIWSSIAFSFSMMFFFFPDFPALLRCEEVALFFLFEEVVSSGDETFAIRHPNISLATGPMVFHSF